MTGILKKLHVNYISNNDLLGGKLRKKKATKKKAKKVSINSKKYIRDIPAREKYPIPKQQLIGLPYDRKSHVETIINQIEEKVLDTVLDSIHNEGKYYYQDFSEDEFDKIFYKEKNLFSVLNSLSDREISDIYDNLKQKIDKERLKITQLNANIPLKRQEEQLVEKVWSDIDEDYLKSYNDKQIKKGKQILILNPKYNNLSQVKPPVKGLSATKDGEDLDNLKEYYRFNKLTALTENETNKLKNDIIEYILFAHSYLIEEREKGKFTKKLEDENKKPHIKIPITTPKDITEKILKEKAEREKILKRSSDKEIEGDIKYLVKEDEELLHQQDILNKEEEETAILAKTIEDDIKNEIDSSKLLTGMVELQRQKDYQALLREEEIERQRIFKEEVARREVEIVADLKKELEEIKIKEDFDKEIERRKNELKLNREIATAEMKKQRDYQEMLKEKEVNRQLNEDILREGRRVAEEKEKKIKNPKSNSAIKKEKLALKKKKERGFGLFDSLKKFGKNVANVFTNSSSPSLDRVEKAYYPLIITRIQIYRTPVQDVPLTLLKAISLGNFDYKSNFDKLYHLYCVLELANETKTGFLYQLTEKTPNIVWEDRKDLLSMATGAEQMIYIVPSTPTTPIVRFGQMIEQLKKNMGQTLTEYTASQYNCQDYILNILKATAQLANTTVPSNISNFIYQDISKVLAPTSTTSKIANKVTDLSHVLNRIGHVVGIGNGLDDDSNIEISSKHKSKIDKLISKRLRF